MSNNEGVFRGPPAVAPPEKRNDPLLQWASKVSEVVGKNRKPFSGFFSQVGKDDEFDAAMAQRYEPMVIKHSGGNTVQHWKIGTADIIPIITKVDTLQTIKTAGGKRHGMALGWRVSAEGRNQSFCKFLCILRPIADLYERPVMITFKSTATGDIIGALMQQYNILSFMEEQRMAANKPKANYPFYAIAAQIGPGEEAMRGSELSSEFIPPANMAPEPMTIEYARSLFIGRDQQMIDNIESYLDEAIEWSIAESRPTTSDSEQDNEQQVVRLGHGVH